MKNLDPKAYWLFAIGGAIRTIFSVVIFTAVIVLNLLSDDVDTSDAPTGTILIVGLIILAVIIMLQFGWSYISFKAYKYELTEDAFKRELGVITKRYVSIPYEKIQNVDIHRGPLARILGLSDLQIQTAGASVTIGRKGRMGMNAEGRLPGLSHQDAETIRDELIKRSKGSKNQGL